MFSRMAYAYGCLMLPVPMTLAESIRNYSVSLPESLVVEMEDDVHVTVKYGILTEDVMEVAKVVEGTLPIVMTLGRAGIFHNQDAAVLKLSVDSQDLQRFHHKVCRKLNTINTHLVYNSHVTVAYLTQKRDDPYYYRTFFRDDFEGQEFIADRAVFSTAGGRRYCILFNGGVTPLN